jgi:hypothetical protein
MDAPFAFVIQDSESGLARAEAISSVRITGATSR